MVEYLRGLEPRRGCGYRHVGKLYIRGEGILVPCHRLPFPLTACPVCGEGIKFTRGWVRLNPRRLLRECGDEVIACPQCGEQMEKANEFAERKFVNIWLCKDCRIAIKRHPEPCSCDIHCPVCHPPEKAFMLWVGEKYYPTPHDFAIEAEKLGVSKAVPSIPRDFELGKTLVYLAHRKAVDLYIENKNTLVGYEMKKHSGIFMAFRPTHFEILIKESDYKAKKEEYDKLEERGIKVIVVPDNYDEMVAKAEEEYKSRKSKRHKNKAKSKSNNNTLAKLISDTVKKVEAKAERWND